MSLLIRLCLKLLILIACSSSLHAANQLYPVRHVIDGDTLVLADGRHVRLLGINAPEIRVRAKPGEPGGEQAAQWLRQRLAGQRVKLELGGPSEDKYGRLLAHLFLDGKHINQQMLSQGLAVASIIPPNLAYAEPMLAAQRRARLRGTGLWARDHYRPQALKRALKRKSAGWQRILLSPLKQRRSGGFLRLVVDEKTDLRIPLKNLRYFPDTENYLGKRLEARGWISRRNGRFSILVRHPSALHVVE